MICTPTRHTLHPGTAEQGDAHRGKLHHTHTHTHTDDMGTAHEGLGGAAPMGRLQVGTSPTAAGMTPREADSCKWPPPLSEDKHGALASKREERCEASSSTWERVIDDPRKTSLDSTLPGDEVLQVRPSAHADPPGGRPMPRACPHNSARLGSDMGERIIPPRWRRDQ